MNAIIIIKSIIYIQKELRRQLLNTVRPPKNTWKHSKDRVRDLLSIYK